MKRCLSIEEAAEYCGVGVPLFEREVRPHVPPLAIGKRIVWDIKTLDEWLDERSGHKPISSVSMGDAYEARRKRKSVQGRS